MTLEQHHKEEQFGILKTLDSEALPPQLFDTVVGQIRTRKGLKPEPNPESYYSD